MALSDMSHPFGCGLCGKSFITAKEYRVHLTLHRHEQINPDLECTVCGKVSKTSNSFRKHAREHIGEYECHICKQNFTTDALRNVHLNSKHDIVFDGYTCETCKKLCGTAEEYLSHVKVHVKNRTTKTPKTNKVLHLETDKTLQSKRQGGTSNSTVSINRPTTRSRSVHQKLKNDGKCAVERSSMDKSRSLSDNDDDVDRTFQLCENCGKLFYSGAMYKQHLNTDGECEGNLPESDSETRQASSEEGGNGVDLGLRDISCVYDSENEHNYCKVTLTNAMSTTKGSNVHVDKEEGMPVNTTRHINDDVLDQKTDVAVNDESKLMKSGTETDAAEETPSGNSDLNGPSALDKKLTNRKEAKSVKRATKKVPGKNGATAPIKKENGDQNRPHDGSSTANDHQRVSKNGSEGVISANGFTHHSDLVSPDELPHGVEYSELNGDASAGLGISCVNTEFRRTDVRQNAVLTQEIHTPASVMMKELVDTAGSSSDIHENDENASDVSGDQMSSSKAKTRGPCRNKQALTLSKLWCDQCWRSFDSFDDFQTHHQLLEHNNSSKWVYMCDMCDERFLRLNDWSVHSEKVHKHFPLKCEKCDYSTAYQWRLTEHIKVRHGQRKLKCPHCPKRRFYYNKELKEHMRGHTDDRPFRCDECQRSFRYRGDLSVHQRTHSNQRPYTCSVCGHGCIQRSDLKVHMRRHTGERPYQCGICSKGFAIPGNLRVHIKKQHPTVDAFIYPCSVCHMVFSGPTLLKRHMMLHNGVKPQQCSYCGSEFASIAHLDKHVLKEHGDKNFSISDCKLVELKQEDVQDVVDELSELPQAEGDEEICDTTEVEVTTEPNNLTKVIQRPQQTERKCYHCNRIFMYTEDFERHMEQHKHPSTLHPVCTICHEQFDSLKAYDTHMQKLHLDAASHACPICEQKFLHFWGLKNHMYKIHKKQIDEDRKRARPKCHLCGKEFDKPSQMTIHLRSHSGEKPYPCSQCPKRFATATLRKQHLKTHRKKRDADDAENQVPDLPSDGGDVVQPVTSQAASSWVATSSDSTSLPLVDSSMGQTSQVLYMTLPCKADDVDSLLSPDMSLSQPPITSMDIPDIQLAHDEIAPCVKLDGSELEHHSYSQPCLTLNTSIDPTQLTAVPLVTMAATVPVIADGTAASSFTDLTVGPPRVITINDISSVLSQPIVLSQTPTLLDSGDLVSIATIVKTTSHDVASELATSVCVPQVSDYQTMPIQEHFKFGVTPEQLEKVSEVYVEEQLQDIPEEYDNSSDLQQDVTRVYDGYKMEQIEVYDPAEVQMLD